MPQRTVKFVAKLRDATKWEHEQRCSFTKEEELTGFMVAQCVQIAKVGGILDILAPDHLWFIPNEQILDIEVTTTAVTGAGNDDIAQAAQEFEQMKRTEDAVKGHKILRFPTGD